jgi:hypothetical protein
LKDQAHGVFRLGLKLQALVLSIGLLELSLLLMLATEAGVIVLVPCFTTTLFIEQGKVGGRGCQQVLAFEGQARLRKALTCPKIEFGSDWCSVAYSDTLA